METRTAFIFRRDDGIISMVIKDNAEVDIEAAKENQEAFIELVGKEECLLLVSFGKDYYATKEAKEFAANSHIGRQVIAEAIIINNLAHKILINFYISFHKPKRSIRMFTKEAEALKWLKTFVK